ncbi:efflux RND transporter permease subunit [Peribacillus sp. SCS-155]|uniref:efflux RND transporter permease subunit n=1 Tax=Peribacillus sedimenti TaxID=3115297 RepID=UPI0039061CC5
MKSIIRFSMKNTVAICLLIVMLIGGGIFAVREMNVEKYPGVDIPYLGVQITYPGASPEQALKDIAEPFEKEAMNIKGVKNVYSDATAWGVWLTLEFAMDVTMDEGEERAREAFSKLELPETAGQLQFHRQGLDSLPIFTAGFVTKGDTAEIEKFVKDTVQPSLEGIEGVAKVETAGIDDKKVYVELLPEQLKKHGLSADQVKQFVSGNNLSIPTGEIIVNDQVLPVRVSKELSSLKVIEDIDILLPQMPTASGQPAAKPKAVKLSDIANISYGNGGTKSYTRINGEEAVTFAVTAEPGANTVAIVKEAKDKLEELDIPAGNQLKMLSDQSVSIQDSVSAMLREAFLGALMAVVVTLLFLRNIRSTLIAIISIPLSIFASLMVLKSLGYTLNIMTLAGIAVAVGRVVDDSIVVIENVFRRVRAAKERNSQLVEESTREVASAITSSTITTVAVFIPMAFVPGIVGKFFAPLAWTIVVSLLFSLLVAVTVVPLMSRIFLLKLKPAEHKENKIQKVYRKTLSWSLSNRWKTLLAAVLILGLSIGVIAPRLGTTFLPQETMLEYNVSIEMDQGINSAKTNEITGKIEDVLLNNDDIKQLSTNVGEGSASVAFTIKDGVENVNKVTADLRKEFDKIDGAKEITVSSTGDMTGGGQSYLQIIVNGPDIDDIKAGSAQMVEALKDVKGLADVRTTLEGDKPEITIDMDEEKLAEHGLMPAMVAQSVRNFITGETVTKVSIDEETTDLQLTMKLDDIDSVETLGEQKITNMMGQQVALNEIGTLKKVNSRMVINHLNGKEYVFVRGTITDSNTGEVSAKADDALNKLDLPKGVSWYKEGASAAMEEGFKNMAIAIAVSILLVYMVMVVAFGEGKAPFVILFAIPFSAIGSLIGLWAVNEPIGMPAMIGLLMLNGIVVTNAIVLLDRVKQNEKQGMEKHQALLEAGVVRIRPILMTAIATVGALLPMAISSHAGLVSRSLAVVVIGGLTTSTLLTLIIVPVLYSLFHPKKKSKADKKLTKAA